MRGVIRPIAGWPVVLAFGLCACAAEPRDDPLEGPADPVEAARQFVSSAHIRRRAMEASVGVADTPYGRLRLSHYALSAATDGPRASAVDWDSLPVYAPLVRALRVGNGLDGSAVPIATSGPVAHIEPSADWEGYVEAGRAAFERYPVQIDPRFAVLRDGVETANRFGLDVQPDGSVRGAVEVLVPDGRWLVALTCAACHAATRPDGTYVPGLTNDRFALSELLGDPRWSHGTMDVTSDGIENPVRPPDLRPSSVQSRLHHAGNLANGRLARMVRVETLLIERLALAARPDRSIVAALSLYLDSLVDGATAGFPDARGAASFEASCGSCHRGPERAGPVVDVGVVGTDEAATRGARATGGYRAPSLLGVAERGAALHDGSARGLAGLLGLAPSDHRGHPFGRELPEDDRRRIARFLGWDDAVP